jgi:endonuclease-3 related protein
MPGNKKRGAKIRKMYRLLERHFGDLGWWPARSAFEVVVGAILTQNTAWSNVEKAIDRLRLKRLLSPAKIVSMRTSRLACLIRPAGYYRIKARRLKEISRFIISECRGELRKLRKADTGKLRRKFLAVKGVGPETADSILLYALKKPVFVVDAYTKRIFSRHGLTSEDASYDEVRSFVHSYFPQDERALNQFHALLVETAKGFCKKRKPVCEKCPLNGV